MEPMGTYLLEKGPLGQRHVQTKDPSEVSSFLGN